MRTNIFIAFVLLIQVSISFALPVLDSTSGLDSAQIEEIRASNNGSSKNLYVVKVAIYEVGILTEGNENDTSIESQERVDLTFFDAHTNQTHIDLGDIPLPIQTNISGQVVTGIAPVKIGAFNSSEDLLNNLLISGTIVNITHSDTAFYQLTTNSSSPSDPHIIMDDDFKTDLAS